MEAQFLNVAENEKGILNLSRLDQLLQVLAAKDVVVDLLLVLTKWHPNYQVCFER